MASSLDRAITGEAWASASARRAEPSALKASDVFCVLLLLAGTIGLIGPYFVLRDPAWLSQTTIVVEIGGRHFDRFAIEWARLLLFVACIYFAVILGFSRSVTSLVRLHTAADRGAAPLRRGFQTLLIVAAVVLSVAFVGPCFDPTINGLSAKLVAWGESHQAYNRPADPAVTRLDTIDARLSSARRSFAWYAVYSAVFWAVLVPVTVLVPLYGFLREDRRHVRRIRRYVADVIHDTDADDAKNRLDQFRRGLTKLATRYVRLMVAISVAVAFELYIGSLAMSEEARRGISVGLILVGVNVVLVVAILYLYYDGWQMVKHRLIDLGESESAIDDKYSPSAYLRFLVKYDYGAVVAAVLAISPWRDQLGQLLAKFVG